MAYGVLIKNGNLYLIAFLGLLPVMILIKTKGEKSVGNIPYASEILTLDITTSFFINFSVVYPIFKK